MMPSDLIEQIIHLPIAERVEIIEKISRSVREDLRETKPSNGFNKEPFTIIPLRLYPNQGFDFDNIGKLIEKAEGDFHR